MHAQDVVAAQLVLDFEATIRRAARLPIFEDHHAGHLVGALHVRDVVALDAQRHLRQIQKLLKLDNRARRARLVRQPLLPQPFEHFARVARGQLDQLAFIPHARRRDAHLLPGLATRLGATIGEPDADGLDVVDRHGQHHLIGNVAALAVVLHHKRPDDLGFAVLAMTIEDEVLAADQSAAPDQEHLDGRVRPLVVDADDVFVVDRRVDDLLLGDDAFGGTDPIPQVGRAFEFQRFGGVFHLVAHIGEHTIRFAIQEADHLIDDLDCPDAWGRTALDVVIEASARIVAGDNPIAQDVRKEAIDRVECLAHRSGVSERTEITRAIALHFARDHRLRPRLLDVDADVWVVFVVAQLDVVARLFVSNEIGFEVQRLGRRLRQQVLDVGDLGHHLAFVGLQGGRLEEVGAHAAAQRLGLADIQQRRLGVIELVDARLVRQSGQLFLDRKARLEHRA